MLCNAGMVTYPDQQGQLFNKQRTLAKVLNDHGAVAYLSGHVHTSLGSELYAQHPVPKHQLWEWTLADWKVRPCLGLSYG